MGAGLAPGLPLLRRRTHTHREQLQIFFRLDCAALAYEWLPSGKKLDRSRTVVQRRASQSIDPNQGKTSGAQPPSAASSASPNGKTFSIHREDIRPNGEEAKPGAVTP